MSNKYGWRKLQIDKIPEDILTGNYEWEIKSSNNLLIENEPKYEMSSCKLMIDVLACMIRRGAEYHYRKSKE